MRETWRGEAGAKGSPVLVAVIVSLMVMMGCRGDPADAADVEPYQVVEIEISGTTDIEEQGWGPVPESLERWLASSLAGSNRGITAEKEGMEMRAVVEHGVHLIPRREGALLRVDMKMQLERMAVENGAPMVVLTASAEYRHPFALGQPTKGVLDPISRILARQAVDDLVGQLRDQAVVRQTLGPELARWVNCEETSNSARLLAIQRVVVTAPEDGPAAGEAALAEAARDVDDDVAEAAARALYELRAEGAAYGLMRVAQRLSRDQKYDRFMALLPLLGRLEVAWVEIYLETVARAHRIRRVRQAAGTALEQKSQIGYRNSESVGADTVR